MTTGKRERRLPRALKTARDLIWQELLVLLELKEDDITEPKLRRLLDSRR